MDPSIYFIGIGTSAFGIVVVVWISAVTSRRTEIREIISELNGQNRHIIRLMNQAWLEENELKSDEQFISMELDAAFMRHRQLLFLLSKTLKAAQIPEEWVFNINDMALLEIEDRESASLSERRKKCMAVGLSVNRIAECCEIEFHARRNKLFWWSCHCCLSTPRWDGSVVQ